MTSWWKKIAFKIGAVEGTGSWEKRVALELEAIQSSGQSGAEKIYNAFPSFRHQDQGSFTKRLVHPETMLPGPAAKSLYFDLGEIEAADPTPGDTVPPETPPDIGDSWTFDRTDITFDSTHATMDGGT